MDFPHPVKLGPQTTVWKLSDLLAFEAAQAGQPAPMLSPGEERFLPVKLVAERYSRSVCTVWRWVSRQ